jgi:hypothetical protein
MDRLRARTIMADTARTLIAVESITTQQGSTNGRCYLYAKLEPIALIVCGAGARQALDMRAQPVDLDALMQAVPVLEARLAEAAAGLGPG